MNYQYQLVIIGHENPLAQRIKDVFFEKIAELGLEKCFVEKNPLAPAPGSDLFGQPPQPSATPPDQEGSFCERCAFM
jgi:hypothetical protein